MPFVRRIAHYFACAFSAHSKRFWHEMLEWKVIQLGDEAFRGRALAEITRLCKPLLDGSSNAFGIEPQIRQKLVDLAVRNERVVYAQNQRGDRGLHA